MGRKFVIAVLSVMIIFTSYMTGFIPVGLSAPVGSEVYAVLGDEKILLSREDAKNVIYILRNEYWRGKDGKCPFDFNIGFEIGNNRYAVAMDGCNTVNMYSVGGEYICGAGTPSSDSRSVTPYYYKYFDDNDIREYFWGEEFTNE